MRSLTSGLVTIALTGIFGCAAMAGCTAEGADVGDLETDNSPTEPAPVFGGDTTGSEDNGSEPTQGATDAGKKDSGKSDAGVDAGPPPPNPGDTCTDGSQIFKKTCNACGQASARCIIPEGQTSGSVSDYGTCENEKAGGCIPGTTQACGNCGTQTCTATCGWTACTGQGTCAAGDVEYTSAGCTANSNTYASRTCSGTCTWSNYSATCAAPVNANKMTLSTTVGSVVSADWTFSPSNLMKKVTGDCGSSAFVSSGYQGVVVEVKNPSTTQTLTFSAYHSKAAGGAELDTLISVYKKTVPPRTDAEYKACDWGIEDSCSATGAPCGNASPPGYNLAGISGITIPPGGKVLVYSVGYSTTTTGAFKLNIRTDAKN